MLYAVYDFLENELGCRWFTPDCSTVPREGTITIPRLRHIYVPPLEYRATDYPNSRDAAICMGRAGLSGRAERRP